MIHRRIRRGEGWYVNYVNSVLTHGIKNNTINIKIPSCGIKCL